MVERNRRDIKNWSCYLSEATPAKDLKLNGRIRISAIMFADVFYSSISSSYVRTHMN